MWKCPCCETINDGEFCVICNAEKPSVVQKPTTQFQNTQEVHTGNVPKQYPSQPNHDEHYATPDTKNTTKIVALILAFILAFVLGAMGIMIYMMSNDSDEITSVESGTEETQTETVQQSVKEVETPESYLFSSETKIANDDESLVAGDSGFVFNTNPEPEDIIANPRYADLGENNKFSGTPVYSFRCWVPDHFIANASYNTFYAPDETAIMQIVDRENINGITTAQVKTNYKNRVKLDEITYEIQRSDNFACSGIKGDVGYYIRGYIGDRIRTFTFVWPMKYVTYQDYVELIEDKFNKSE